MWFSGFFFLILSLIVEVYLWWQLQASLIFLRGRDWWLTKYFFAPLYLMKELFWDCLVFSSVSSSHYLISIPLFSLLGSEKSWFVDFRQQARCEELYDRCWDFPESSAYLCQRPSVAHPGLLCPHRRRVKPQKLTEPHEKHVVQRSSKTNVSFFISREDVMSHWLCKCLLF